MKFACFAAAAVLALACVPASASELVVNGGFETGDFTGWTHNNDSDGFQWVDPSKPHTGSFAAHMGVNPNDLSPGEFANLEQMLPTVAGQDYTLSFWLDAEDGSQNGSEFKAEVGGTTLLDLVNTVQNYTFYSFNFTAANSGTLLDFQHFNGPTHFFLDDVSVTGLSSDVPEPATLALMGAGLAGFAAMRRRKKRA